MFRLALRIFAIPLLAYLLGYAWFAVSLPQPAGDQRTDAIVVLTGGTNRLDRGFELMERRLAERMLISGVERTVRARELADVYRVPADLFNCCIELGREAFDTRSNGDEVARWVDKWNVESFRLITNDLHMPRARFEILRRVNPNVTIIEDAVPTPPSARALFLEYNKFLLGWVADRIGI